MSKRPISSDSGPIAALPPVHSGWADADALTDDDVETAALTDPDAQPLTDAQLRSARRVGVHGTLRLKLSRAEFASRYHIPVDTVRGWEQGTLQPDAVAEALLYLISVDPEGVARELLQHVAAE